MFDLIEDILLRLSPKDLVRCKSVCKSWYYLISSRCFVNAHLKHTHNNEGEGGDKRIVFMRMSNEHVSHKWKIVGSSNGLVCMSPYIINARIFITNPSTMEIRKLPVSPLLPTLVKYSLCFSYGYDSSTDDYKVVMGIRLNCRQTLVQVFSLKLNIWKIVGQIKYVLYRRKSGILLDEAIHWFAIDGNMIERKVILSFDLSREEFKIIPQPDDSRYAFKISKLGIYQGCLCIYCSDRIPYDLVWVLRNYNNKKSWELLPNDCEMNYDNVHYMRTFKDRTFCCDDNISFDMPRKRRHFGAPLYMQSLVSPYVNERPSHTMNNKKPEEGHESIVATKSGSKKRNTKRKRPRYTTLKVTKRMKRNIKFLKYLV